MSLNNNNVSDSHRSRPNSVESFDVRSSVGPVLGSAQTQWSSQFHHLNSDGSGRGGVVVSPQMQQQYYSGFQQNSDYLTQYYAHYYREYYRKYLAEQRRLDLNPHGGKPQTPQRLNEVMKYGSRVCHPRASFNPFNNRLVVVSNVSASIQEVVLTQLLGNEVEPKLMVPICVPFQSREKALQWIQYRLNSFSLNFELKMCLKTIQLFLKSEKICAKDFAQLLYEFLDLSQYESITVSSSHVTSHSAHTHAFTDQRVTALNTYRLLVMKGEQRMALNHALTTHLYDHALCLSYLTSPLVLSACGGKEGEEDCDWSRGAMTSSVRRFIANSLDSSDPLHVLYSVWLSLKHHNNYDVKRVHEVSFDAFLTLLANGMPLKSVSLHALNSVDNNEYSFGAIFKLIKRLLNQELSQPEFSFNSFEHLFDSKMDSILMNELLDYCLCTTAISDKLFAQKLYLMSVLFDFGLKQHANNYYNQLLAKQSTETNVWTPFLHFCSQFVDTTNNTEEDHSVNHSLNQNFVQQNEDKVTKENDFYGQMFESETNNALLNNGIVVSDVTNETMLINSDIVLTESVVNNDSDVTPMETMATVDTNSVSFVSTPVITSPTMLFGLNNSFGEELSERKEMFTENEFLLKQNENQMKEKDKREKSAVQQHSQTVVNNNHNSNSTGILSSILGKFKSKQNKAILPDDRDMSLVFDKHKQQWIDRNETTMVSDNNSATTMKAPPIMTSPLLSDSNQHNNRFQFNRNKRYVDVLHNK